MQSRRLLLRRNELSRSLRSRQRRTKNVLRPVRNCENSSKRFGHPARSFLYGVFKENLFKRQKRNDWLAWPGATRTHHRLDSRQSARGAGPKGSVTRRFWAAVD